MQICQFDVTLGFMNSHKVATDLIQHLIQYNLKIFVCKLRDTGNVGGLGHGPTQRWTKKFLYVLSMNLL